MLELIRSRRLRERYALLWLLTGVVLLVALGLALRAEHDRRLGRVTGYPPAVLFAVGALFVLLVLLRLLDGDLEAADQNTVLAQRLALLEQRTRER